MLEHTHSIIPVSICLRDSYYDTNFFSDRKELCFQFCQKKVQALFYMEQFSKGPQRRHLFGNMKEKKSKKTERENDAELTTEIEIGKRKREKKQKKMEKNIFKN